MSLRSFFVHQVKVQIRPNEEYITLGVLLKIEGIIQTGGMAKAYLADNPVLVNGEPDNRRGRKLYPGDVVEVEKTLYLIEDAS